jgi:hypothetical protein
LVRKADPVEANALKRKLNESHDYITNVINPYMCGHESSMPKCTEPKIIFYIQKAV